MEAIVGLRSCRDIIVFFDIAKNGCGMDEAVAVVATEVAVMAAEPWIVWVAFADCTGVAPIVFCDEVAVAFGIDDRKVAEGGIDELHLESAAKSGDGGFGRKKGAELLVGHSELVFWFCRK
jgi:hypothetical protein